MNRRLSIIIALLAALSSLTAFAQDTATNTPGGLDRNSLELIVRKNIFDPTRVGIRPVRRQAPAMESFTFCGGAFDGPHAVAFFSGAGASNKPLRPGDTINGFKVSDITFNSVKVQSASGPPQTLAMGMSMRREANGPWKPSAQPVEAEPAAAASDASTAALPASAANENDIIKKLKARRDDD
jgi:hypothetical protein